MFLQFAGSVIAVALLVLIAWRLGLGGDAHIADDAEARELADATLCGFEAGTVSLDTAGRGALLRGKDGKDGKDGKIVLLAPHGNRFVGRVLDRRASAHIDGVWLVITTGERRLAPVRLALADGAAWCRAIEALD